MMGANSPMARWLLAAALAAGLAARVSVVAWSDPWTPHQWDEHVLQLEALGLWEGVTPREVGWPGSTTRLMLSAVAAAEWMVTEGANAWRLRQSPDEALEDISAWIGQRFIDPALLYRPGRFLSVVTGFGQLLVLAWALGRWVRPSGVAAGVAAAALSPVAVEYSQYVLADMTGLLFATVVLGLAARPTWPGVLAMAAFAALATASKFHFGLWSLTPLLCVWIRMPGGVGVKLARSGLVIATFVVVLVTLVPWFWLNPVLMVKEFFGVVGSKVGYGASPDLLLVNGATALGSFGALALAGTALTALAGRIYRDSSFWVVFVPTFTGAVAVLGSAVAFNRYGLAFLPGVLLLSAVGWQAALEQSSRAFRVAARVAMVAAVVWTSVALIRAERVIGAPDVDVQVKAWILQHVPRGSRVAIHHETNAFLPRTARQLQSCASYIDTGQAFEDKWRIEGFAVTSGSVAPMKRVLMNDELFQAFWCVRELQVQRDPGYEIVAYHSEPRFAGVLEVDAIREFRDGTTEVTGGIDVLVVNRPVAVGVEPVMHVVNARGQRVIYRR